MKIAITHVNLPNDTKGGVAHQVHYFANQLVLRGHDVTMFSFSQPFDGCHYELHQLSPPASALRKFWPFFFAAALAKVDFSSFDLVHTNGDSYLVRGSCPHLRTFYGSAQDEARTAVRLRRKVAQTVFAGLEQVNARVADLNVGISRTTQQRIPAVSEIIPCGVDLSNFRAGTKAKNPAVLFVGTRFGRKRGELLANAFREKIAPKIPNAELWTVADEPMEGEGIVNFGRVSLEQLCELYQRAWVFCLPSSYEGFGVPYIEAMASGTAVVATDNPGAAEILNNGEFGFISPDLDLGDTIAQLLADRELRKSYELKGISYSRIYSWDSVVNEYERLYERMIGSRIPVTASIKASV